MLAAFSLMIQFMIYKLANSIKLNNYIVNFYIVSSNTVQSVAASPEIEEYHSEDPIIEDLVVDLRGYGLTFK
jgi:hypothetical protein